MAQIKGFKIHLMIQRIQTLFLLLTILLLAGYMAAPVQGYEMEKASRLYKGYEVVQSVTLSDGKYFLYINVILTATAAALSLIAVFLYKNRPVQILLAIFSMVFIASAVAFVFYKYQTRECLFDSMNMRLIACTSVFTAWNLLPAAAIASHIAAIIFIRKDEALVKSLDRLR